MAKIGKLPDKSYTYQTQADVQLLVLAGIVWLEVLDADHKGGGEQ